MNGPTDTIANRGAYKHFAEQYGLRFFRVMAELYDLTRQRPSIGAWTSRSSGSSQMVISSRREDRI